MPCGMKPDPKRKTNEQRCLSLIWYEPLSLSLYAFLYLRLADLFTKLKKQPVQIVNADVFDTLYGCVRCADDISLILTLK